jgi:alpha-beta hydrolase superfamily lysophospholipase
MQAEDGQTLFADHSGSGTRGVLLIHGQDRNAKDWTSLSQALVGAGHQVLAVDLRGHGRSEAPALDEADVSDLLSQDVRAAVAWLKGNGVKDLSLVGAQLGANLALHAAAADTDIDRLVLLSPGLNIQGVRIVAPIATFSGRPLMLVASRGDPVSSKAATLLEAQSKGETTLILTDGGARGAGMLNTDNTLEGTVLAWLAIANATDTTSRDRGPNATSLPGAVRTSGTLLEDRN